ncbi:MAG TPA: MMPL family transporter [Solirubrobacteraceae bacterium]|nr:MMPL family transporter [Solirubrobacteraceae bacterium]
MRLIATWCYRHRWLVAAAWMLAALATTAAKSAVGSRYASDFRLPHTQSFAALALLQQSAPRASGATDELVVAVRRGQVTDPAVRQRVTALLDRVARVPHVTEIGSPYAGARGARQIAPSGRIAFATITFDVGPAQISGAQAGAYTHIITSASGRGVQFEVNGRVAGIANPQSSGTALPIGFLAAGVVLFVVFGSLMAMLLPLLTAAVSLGTGIAAVGLLSNLVTMADFSGELSLLIGLGVGVDYALFIVTRYRQALLRSLSREEAVVEAIDTSGRAVMFAGLIVCIAMLGMFALGVSFLYGVAIAAAITVAFTVLASVTLLPALLALFGERALRRGERRLIKEGRFRSGDESPGWSRWTDILRRRPALFAAAAAVAMLVIGAPSLSMRLGSADASSDPASTTTHKAYELLVRGFGAGYNGPLQLVGAVRSPTQERQFSLVLAAARETPDVVAVTRPQLLAGRHGHPDVELADVYPRGGPQAASTAVLLERLRNQVVPRASRGTALHVLVAGQTAIFTDFATVLDGKLPLFIGAVVMLSFLLLTVVFRSLLIPFTAAMMNLLSTAGSLGVVTAVFQLGWLRSLTGFSSGPIESFLPVLLFPILFGLSMDYEVFLVSRIYEEWHARRSTRDAVAHGLAATGKTITAAAAIMVLVFGAFVLGGERVIELFGVGLASAVLLDAVIVRSILLPAVMLLLGELNWALPQPLERLLPHLRIEGWRAGRELGTQTT